jgi:hypothetical protein
VVSLGKGEQQIGYSNLKKFRNKIDYFNKKIKEVWLISKKYKILNTLLFEWCTKKIPQRFP